MGTNYYAVDPMTKERLHIGKSSVGWCFQLRLHPNRGINNLFEWKGFLIHNSFWYIVDGEGNGVSYLDMMSCIEERSGKLNWDLLDWNQRRTYDVCSEEEFHRRNDSERGPNGLLRAKIDGVRVVEHGSGTWDCLVNDFS